MIRIQPQWGVFIGGYRDFKSASDDLAKVKKTPEPPEDRNVLHGDILDPQTKQIYTLHTYAQCIATRNPTVRMQRADPNAPDPAWKHLNEGRPYNLLDCRKEWTLAVKQFQNTSLVQPRTESSKFLDLIGLGGSSGDYLEASAKQAEELAKVLRGRGFNLEAYVLHTRLRQYCHRGRLRPHRRSAYAGTGRRSWPTSPLARPRTRFACSKQPLPMRVPRL